MGKLRGEDSVKKVLRFGEFPVFNQIVGEFELKACLKCGVVRERPVPLRAR